MWFLYIILGIIAYLILDWLFVAILRKATDNNEKIDKIVEESRERDEKQAIKKRIYENILSEKMYSIKNPYPYQKGSKNNNMNFDTYVFSARNLKTKRIHENETLTVMDGEDAEFCIKSLGYETPIQCEKQDFPPANFRQEEKYLALVGYSLPSNASYQDAETLIICNDYDETVKGQDTTYPHPELVKYATDMHIKFSYYIGKKHLYRLIFNSLDTENKITFYTFCVYKDLMHKKGFPVVRNPKKCAHYSEFCEFAKQKMNDSSYLNSLSHIEGDTLRFFGKQNFHGKILNGASIRTTAYLETAKFLKDNLYV